jgi:hypothetical protein
MDYLDRTGHAASFKEEQSTAARAIIVAWRSGGVQHRIKLANVAIWAVEQNEHACGLSCLYSEQMTVQLFGPKGDLAWCMRLQSNG